jgi:hypothetical protein
MHQELEQDGGIGLQNRGMDFEAESAASWVIPNPTKRNFSLPFWAVFFALKGE